MRVSPESASDKQEVPLASFGGLHNDLVYGRADKLGSILQRSPGENLVEVYDLVSDPSE